MHPTDEQLRAWRRPSQDSFVERKSASDAGDWIRTIVAFANSTPPGRCGVLYIGVRDDGTVEGLANLDSVQKP
jgi:predicted HTH transcriptional regulator